MKKQIALFLIALILVTGCQPSEQAIQTAMAQTQLAWTPIPTQTAYFTYTPQPTTFVTKIVTQTFTPTPKYTSTPEYTPTITNTPTLTSTPTLTPDTLRMPKSDGFYLIGVDIAPGVWRSTGTGTGCYWSVTTKTGDIIDNHFGQAGGTAYLPPNGFQVQFEDCGIWEFISPP